MPLAKKKALGNPNRTIEQYRKGFDYIEKLTNLVTKSFQLCLK